MQHSAHGVHGDTRKAHPADDIKETLDGQLGECGLSSEALHRSERLVLYCLLGLFNRLRIDLHLTHTNLGFKGPGVLIKQTADVTELILTRLDLCLQRADFQRTGINQALHLVAIFAELHNAFFQRCEFLSERQLLSGDQRAHIVELANTLVEFALCAARCLADGRIDFCRLRCWCLRMRSANCQKRYGCQTNG